ncbi:MAG: flavodoxin family protein [Solobacterium sp.]|nr:flavodoxin family protein [Solobacterium sp.]
MQRCRCCWKDDLSPLIERIFSADTLIIGTPIYMGDITSQVHALIERLHFCALSYDDYSNYFTGRVNTGIILTMNANQAFYNLAYRKKAKELARSFRQLNGTVEVLPVFDTLQVADYTRYDMSSFNAEHKKERREKQFPEDLKKLLNLGLNSAQKLSRSDRTNLQTKQKRRQHYGYRDSFMASGIQKHNRRLPG